MSAFNRVILMGNLTRDPQLSTLPSGTTVCEFGLAVNTRYGGDGQQKESVCFIDCRAFGRLAETVNQYLSKGRQALIEGRLDFDQWEAPDGQKRSKHRVTVASVQFIGGRDDAASAPPAQPRYTETTSRPAPGLYSDRGGGFLPPNQRYKPPPADYDGGPEPEDIPF